MKEKEERLSLTRGSLLTFSSNILIFILSMIPVIIIARVLGPTLKGVYVLTALIPTVLLQLGTFGIQISNVYYAGNRKYKISEISSNSIAIGLFLGVMLIFIFWIITKLSNFQNFLYSNGINIFYLWLVISVIPFSLIGEFHHFILVGREKIFKFNILNIFQICFDIVAVILFLIIFKMGFWGVILWWILSAIIMCLARVYFVNKLEKFKLHINFSLLKDSFRFGIKSYLGNIAQFLNYRLDMFLVAYFLNPIFVGFYSVAVGFAEKLWMVPGSISTILFPRVSSVETKIANNLTPRLTRLTFWTILIISFILVFIAQPFIKILYGVAYLPAVTPFILLLPGIVSMSVCQLLSADLNGRGKPQFSTFASLISLSINIPLNLILIPKWGINGAAIASTIAYLVSTVVIVNIFAKISGNSIRRILIIRKDDINMYIYPKLKMLLNFKKITNV